MKQNNTGLNSFISFGKAFSKLTKIGQIAAVGAAIFVIFSMGTCSGKTDLDKFIVEYEEFKDNAKNVSQYADSLKTEVVTLQDSVVKTETTVKKLKIEIAFNSKVREQLKVQQRQIQTELASVTTLQDTVVVQDKIIANLETQLFAADSTITTQTEVISLREQQLDQMKAATNLAVQRGDSLQTILSSRPETPKNPDKWILGIKKPSRTTVAITSLLVGVVIGAQIAK